MKPRAVVGAVLIQKVLDLGPIEATADDKKSVPIPPLLGVLAVVGGVVLVATSARRA
jgi:hypothetical protein